MRRLNRSPEPMNRNKELYMLIAATSWRYLALFALALLFIVGSPIWAQQTIGQARSLIARTQDNR